MIDKVKSIYRWISTRNILFQIGDQILEVNGQSFLDVTHDEAVNQLKYHKRMMLAVRDVGKVPHSCTSYDMDPWETPQG